MKKDIIISVLIVATISVFLLSCKTTKNIGTTKEVYDSLYVKELEQKVRTLEIENGELTSRVNELEFLGVEFDNNCDSVLKNALLKSGCNADSINAIMNMYRSRIKTFADGTVEAEGFIKGLKKVKERNEELISRYKKEIDSLNELKQKEVVKKQVVTVTKQKVITKTKGFWWWLFVIIGYGISIVLPPKKISSFAKSIIKI